MRKKRQKQQPPIRPHPSSEQPTYTNNRTGHILDRAEQVEKWIKAGLCHQCGIVETHKIFLRGTVRVPQVCCGCCSLDLVLECAALLCMVYSSMEMDLYEESMVWIYFHLIWVHAYV